jgi:hypothetical protein
MSSFYTLAFLHLPSIHLPNTAWIFLRGTFLLAPSGGLSWLNRHPDMTCPAHLSNQLAEFHYVILIIQLIEFLVGSNSPSCPINHLAINSPEHFMLKITMTLFILWIKTNTVHFVSSIYLLLMQLLHVAAPTCHPRSVVVLMSTWKLRQLCTASGNVNLCLIEPYCCVRFQ